VKRRLGTLVVAGALAVGVGCSPASSEGDEAAAGSERPNVLFVVVDDLRPELGCYGASVARTPHLDRLAADGALFRRAYCQESLCNPSRVSVLTGLHPWSSGFSRNRQSFREVLPDVVTLPQHFRQSGWRSVAVGKVFHEGTEDPDSWSEPAWDAPFESNYVEQENRALAQSRGQRVPIERGDAPDDAYRDGRVARRAVEVLRAHDPETPLFLAVGFVRPHLPFAAPAEYFDAIPPFEWDVYGQPPVGSPEQAGRIVWPLSNYGTSPLAFARRRAELVHAYYAATSFVDAQIGRILDELDALGLDDDTIVVVWGDHGYYLGEYGLWGKTGCFDVALRSPLVMRVPGREPGTVLDAPVELVDLFPTLCELADLAVPAGLDGRSFAAALDDPSLPGRDAALSWHSSRRSLGWSVRTARYRLTSWRDPSAPRREVAIELYDHAADEAETVNVAHEPAHADALERLRAHLTPFEEASGAGPR